METTHTDRLRRLANRLRDSRAQALVEAALVFPIMVTIVLGAADLSTVAHASIAVSNAAKAGAQYASQNGYTAQDSTGIATAASNEAPKLTITTTSSYACICSDGSSSTCLNTDCPKSHMEETVTVNTQTTVTPLVQLPGLPATWTLKGEAIQRCVE